MTFRSDVGLILLDRVFCATALYRTSAGYKKHDPLSYSLPNSKTDDGVKIKRAWREEVALSRAPRREMDINYNLTVESEGALVRLPMSS
jgi:hypothetical protein